MLIPKSSILFSLVLGFSFIGSITFATETVNGEVTQIKADFRCENKGGGIAVAMPTETTAAKVWQSELGSATGIEIQLTSFTVARCMGCFSFTGILMKDITVQGTSENFELIYTASHKQEAPVELLRAHCLPTENSK